MIKKTVSTVYRLSLASMLLLLSFQPQGIVYAAASLTIEPITWNVIGLDSNDETSGPQHFPIGARVCNTGIDPATNVSSQFVWGDTTTTYINLRPGSNTSYSGYTIAADACVDFYYEVEITRSASAYENTRPYTITVTADGGISESTPSNRELFIEYLISQNRNGTDNVYFGDVGGDVTNSSEMTKVAAGGTMTLAVGQTYDMGALKCCRLFRSR